MSIKFSLYLKRVQLTQEGWMNENDITSLNEFIIKTNLVGLSVSDDEIKLANKIIKQQKTENKQLPPQSQVNETEPASSVQQVDDIKAANAIKRKKKDSSDNLV